jgi:hypothetical protein
MRTAVKFPLIYGQDVDGKIFGARECRQARARRPLPSVVVTMATPVANAAKLLRNSRASNIGAIRIC